MARLTQHGDETAPKRGTVIRYSSEPLSRSQPGGTRETAYGHDPPQEHEPGEIQITHLPLQPLGLVRNDNNNNELYLHDHTNTYSIVKAMFRDQNYNTG